ncbi:hypothetical protein LWI29_027302 [Acer saccharum]|uniref:Uncharacterized protein n=1 Tax=Acer saccharum TaxID=4024 RepID=A0AA39TI39_ACESA|nr:hypothetical protein LWI29_027302 [Acer saccharum]
MPRRNPNANLWWFPDHESRVTVRVNSESYDGGDGIDASIKKQEIGGSVRKSRSIFSGEYSPPSKKRLFSDGNSKVPSTIPELYAELRAAMVDSEERIVAFCKDEFAKIRNEMKGAEQDDEMKEDVGGHKAAVQEDKSIDEEDVGVGVGVDAAAANEEDVGGKPAGDKADVQEDAGDKAAGNRVAGDRGAAEENSVEKAAVEEDAVEEAAVEEDEAIEKQDVEEHEAVVEAFLAVGSTAIEGDVMVEEQLCSAWEQVCSAWEQVCSA